VDAAIARHELTTERQISYTPVMRAMAAKPRAPVLRFAAWSLALGLASQLSVSCLSLGSAEESPASGGAGTGGSNLGDAPWGTGGTSADGAAGSAGSTGSGGSGGFVPATCDTCGAANGCECVPEVGQGWTHVRVADGKVSSCPGAAQAPLVVGTGAVDTGCQTCECGTASGASCGFALVYYSYAGCASTGYYSGVHTKAGDCISWSGSKPGVMPKAFSSGGSCGPGTAPAKPPAFATPKTLCPQPSTGACGTAGSCVAAAAPSFDAKACVMFESQGVDVACPPGYPDKLPFSTGFDDTRSCSCTCKPSIGCTGGTVVFDCATGTANVAGKCQDGTVAGDYKVVAPPSVSGAGCSPDTAPKPAGGSVQASGLRVVCCR
jgi:hypothetical protein